MDAPCIAVGPAACVRPAASIAPSLTEIWEERRGQHCLCSPSYAPEVLVSGSGVYKVAGLVKLHQTIADSRGRGEDRAWEGEWLSAGLAHSGHACTRTHAFRHPNQDVASGQRQGLA
jgi:hypothetical protein